MAAKDHAILAERLIRIVRRMGHDYTDRREPGLDEMAHPEPGSRRCVHVACHGFNPRHARFCAHCGRPLRADAAMRLAYRRMKERRREALRAAVEQLRALPGQIRTELSNVPGRVARQAWARREPLMAASVMLAVIALYVVLTMPWL